MYPYNIDSNKNTININSNDKSNNILMSEDKRLIKLLALITEETKNLYKYYRDFYKNIKNTNKDENTKESLKEIYVDILKALKFLENIYFMVVNKNIDYNDENKKNISNNFNNDIENSLIYMGEHSKNIRHLYTLFSDSEIKDMLFELLSDALCDMAKINFIYMKNNKNM